MAQVSIDIDAMATLASSLEAAQVEWGPDAVELRGRLDSVQLDASMLAPGYVAELAAWVEVTARDVQRRLSLARVIAASEPDLRVVTFDESVISDLLPAQVDAAAAEVAELMRTAADGVPAHEAARVDPRLLELLDEHALDPYFAASLARWVGPQEIDLYLSWLARGRGSLSNAQLAAADADYERFVTVLAVSLGVASSNTGTLASPDLAQRYIDYFRHTRPGEGGASRVGVVIGRGQFDTDFLLDLGDGILAIEHDSGLGAAFWANDALTAIDIDAGGDVRVVQDPMYGVLLAMQANPEAMRQWLTRPGEAELRFGDERRTVDASLEQLMMRHVDSTTMHALFGAIQVAHLTAPAGHALHEHMVGEQLGHFQDYFQWSLDNAPPWWKEAIHAGLDIAGMFPVVGEWADGLNATLYARDGRWRDAAISAGAAALGVGTGAVIARMAGRSRARQILDDQAAIARRLDEVWSGQMAVLRPDGRWIGVPGSSAGIRVVAGDLADAQAMFERLSRGGTVVFRDADRIKVQLPYGGSVQLRTKMTRSPDAAATVDIKVPGLPWLEKIKFVP